MLGVIALLPKNKSRKITVRGTEYRWLISRGNRLIIQAVIVAGQKLEISFDIDKLKKAPTFINNDGEFVNVITPKVVSDVIIKALDLDWKPLEPKKSLNLSLDSNGNLI